MPPKKQTAAAVKKRAVEEQRMVVWTLWAVLALFWVGLQAKIENCETLGDNAGKIDEFCNRPLGSLTSVRVYGGMVLIIMAVWIAKVV
jgi:hypothetical protein